MLRKLLLGLAATATLGGSALIASPASAQYFGYGPAYGFGYRPAYYGYGPRWGGYYGRPYYGGYRPAYYGYGGGYWGGRCVVRPGRVWNGYGWVVGPRRVCY